ncbi:RHS repeat-associated core domain protein, partial [Neisseria sp. oral taxon 014 str. F0314]|uniref:RHS repeat domain-containing protein n=1 Tax=Neisseria sp. oral taxon 014 TaxID=641148 RepID=UPI0001D8C05E
DALDRRIAKEQVEVGEEHRPAADGKGRLKTVPGNRIEFVWDGSHLLQEIHPHGSYTYVYTDQDSYEPLAQICEWEDEAGETRRQVNYFHCDQIGLPREMTDGEGRLLWFGNYGGWGKLTEETNIANAHQPFRLQNQYCDGETGLHYNFFRYYDPHSGRFVTQDPIGLLGDENFYTFASNVQEWIDPLGLKKKASSRKPKFVSTKSTGRTKPRNALESKIMDQVKKRPEKGNVIIRADQIGDRCYAGKGWNKMEQKIDGVTIHYMAKFDKAGKMTHVTDFKFK